MRGELKNRLSNVRGVLLSALDKAKTDISEIRRDVENGMIWKVVTIWNFATFLIDFK